MASVSKLVDFVANITGERVETISVYARALIDAGLLPKSRGRAVAQIEPVHVIRLVTAFALEPKIKDTAGTVAKYLGMIREGVPDSAPKRLKETAEEYLVGFLGALFSRPKSDAEKKVTRLAMTSEITFVRNWPEIEVKIVHDASEPLEVGRFKAPASLPGFWEGFTKRTTVISGRLFLRLACDLFDDDTVDEWTAMVVGSDG